MKRKIFVTILCLCLMMGMAPYGVQAESRSAGEDSGDGKTVVPVATEQELMALLRDASGKTGNYQLQNDLMIDSSDLDLESSEAEYFFDGTLDGNKKTITVVADEKGKPAAPLFDTLRGSVSNLNVVFEGDVKGSAFARHIRYQEKNEPVSLNHISVTVNGSVLYGSHDYRKYYGHQLSPENSTYGNWYIHYGGQPVNLAAGFAWYIWGVSLSDITVNITGNIGKSDRMEGDTTSAGFAYFAVNGEKERSVIFDGIDVHVEGDIQSYTGDGHASAYGFAAGTTDAPTAGFGGNVIQELKNSSVSTSNIVADSLQGSSSAIGFARFMQGYTHDCGVRVTGAIKAVNAEGDEEEAKYAYSNGDAYAYGFMLNTGGWSIDSRRNFCDNIVTAGEITAETNSESLAGGAWASGFAHQMMNSASSVPDLSYHDNRVNVKKRIHAAANKKDAVAAGFVTHSGRDSRDHPDHIYENNVEIQGDILAESRQGKAYAAGYAYLSNTHRRNCTVTVDGGIAAVSPVQPMAAGFVTIQSTGQNYFLKDCEITVAGDIRATGMKDGGNGIAAGGAALLNYMYSADNLEISGNTVSVGGSVFCDGTESSNGFTGLIAGYFAADEKKVNIYLKDNHFTGTESLVEIKEEDLEAFPEKYTYFTNILNPEAMAEIGGNTVQFTDKSGRTYRSDVELTPDSESSRYGTIWKLTKIEEVVRMYEITAEAGAGGRIDPSGTVLVKEGESRTFVFTPDDGFHVSGIEVDGKKKSADRTYTFENVSQNHAITVSFAGNSSGGGNVHSCTLHYDTKGGEKIKPEMKSVSWVKKFEDMPVPVREKYIFDGWYFDSALTNPVKDDVRVDRSSVTLYAAWSKDMSDPDNNGVSGWLNTRDHNSYLNGYEDYRFGPDRHMSRGEAAQMFYNLLLDKNVKHTVSFTDVPEGAWYAEAVGTLASLGMIEGVGENLYCPERPVTRAEFAAIAMRFAGTPSEQKNLFSDVSEENWFYYSVTGAASYGWINGYPDGTFRPSDSVARSEVTAAVNRMLNRSADKEYVDKYAESLREFTDVTAEYWAYYEIAEAANSHRYKKSGHAEHWENNMK